MAPVGGIGERYATQVGALWSGLARTLFELEQLAADPVQLDDEDSIELLRRLQAGLGGDGRVELLALHRR